MPDTTNPLTPLESSFEVVKNNTEPAKALRKKFWTPQKHKEMALLRGQGWGLERIARHVSEKYERPVSFDAVKIQLYLHDQKARTAQTGGNPAATQTNGLAHPPDVKIEEEIFHLVRKAGFSNFKALQEQGSSRSTVPLLLSPEDFTVLSDRLRQTGREAYVGHIHPASSPPSAPGSAPVPEPVLSKPPVPEFVSPKPAKPESRLEPVLPASEFRESKLNVSANRARTPALSPAARPVRRQATAEEIRAGDAFKAANNLVLAGVRSPAPSFSSVEWNRPLAENEIPAPRQVRGDSDFAARFRFLVPTLAASIPNDVLQNGNRLFWQAAKKYWPDQSTFDTALQKFLMIGEIYDEKVLGVCAVLKAIAVTYSPSKKIHELIPASDSPEQTAKIGQSQEKAARFVGLMGKYSVNLTKEGQKESRKIVDRDWLIHVLTIQHRVGGTIAAKIGAIFTLNDSPIVGGILTEAAEEVVKRMKIPRAEVESIFAEDLKASGAWRRTNQLASLQRKN